MRRAALLGSACGLALLLAACGGSGGHAATRASTSTGPLSRTPVAGTAGVHTSTTGVRARPAPSTPAAIRHAALLTAAQPGFRANVSASVSVPQLGGNDVTAVGSGYFDPGSGTGTLNVAVTLPGLLSFVGPLPTQIILAGDEAYVRVPSDLAGMVPSSETWLGAGLTSLGLGTALSPPDILREVARDATRTVPDQRAHVTLDPGTGLIRNITLAYRARGYRVHAHLHLTGFTEEPASPPPPPTEVGDLTAALQQLGF